MEVQHVLLQEIAMIMEDVPLVFAYVIEDIMVNPVK